MATRLYQPLTKADLRDKRSTKLGFEVRLPAEIAAESFRIRTYEDVLIVDLDFSATLKESKTTGDDEEGTGWFQAGNEERAWLLLPDESRDRTWTIGDEVWLLEYRLKTKSIRTDYQQLDELYQGLRDLALAYLEDTPAPLEESRYWDAVQQAAVELVAPELWWVSYATGPEVTPYSPKTLSKYKHGIEHDWKQLDVDIDLDQTSFKSSGQWLARVRAYLEGPEQEQSGQGLTPIEEKERFDWILVGPMPRPASRQLQALRRFAIEMGRVYRDRKERERVAVCGDPSTNTDVRVAGAREGAVWQGRDALAMTLQRIRSQILQAVEMDPLVSRGIADGLSQLFAANPMVLTFLVERQDAPGYVYHWDPDQKRFLERNLRKKPGLGSLEDLFEGLSPPPTYVERVQKTGISIYRTNFLDRQGENEEFDNELFSEVFGSGKPPHFLLLIPIAGPGGKVTESKSGAIPALAQVIWPRGTMPMIPEVQVALQQAVIGRALEILSHVQAHRLYLEFGRYQFVRNFSYMLAHNLPKVTVTPLITLADRVEAAGLKDLVPVAARMRGIAYFLEAQLHGLDVFRLPGTREVTLEPVDLLSVLEEIQTLFDFIVDNTARLWSEMAQVRTRIHLDIVNNAGEVVQYKGYRPSLFQVLFVPIDNAFKALDPALIREDPARGLVEVELISLTDCAIEVQIRDRGTGMTKALVDELNGRLADIRATAQRGGSVDLQRHSGTRSGDRMGLGLPLCAQVLALFKDETGNTGELCLESTQGEGTLIRICLPCNDAQETITF